MNTIITGRLDSLRAAMRDAGVSAAIIPHTDPHQSEYLAEHWQVRRWLSGFNGSAGTLVVTADDARLWTDSRYFLQAAQQLEGTGITLMKDGLADTPSIEKWLTTTLQSGSSVGIDGMLFSLTAVEKMKETFAAADINLDTAFAPIDTLWTSRPALPSDSVFVHDEKYAGEGAVSKINRILDAAKADGANAFFISALDEIAWILNIRSTDVECNPVATAFLYLSADTKTLFIDESKIDEKTGDYLQDCGVDVAPYANVARFLALLPASAKVLIEPGRTGFTLATVIGRKAVRAASPVALPKAVKNATQIEGMKAAMARDGAALVNLFMEIERRLAAGEPTTELDVEALGTKYRSEQPLYVDNSFGMIAGYGPHGAIVHYSATPATAATLEPRGLLLVDSGGQYLDGTTDITRTVALGTPTAQERTDFTLVMKGHIALSQAVFPEGTRGDQLDALARMPLWQHGLTYLHGTGHGVGHFLNVHEGPQSIRLNHVNIALRPGMITSNEPGLYRANIHGIRCENLVLTVEAPELSSAEFGNFLRFEILTLFPFDLKLFDTAIMTDGEIEWINNYHQRVREGIMPLLTTEAQRNWLIEKTSVLCR